MGYSSLLRAGMGVGSRRAARSRSESARTVGSAVAFPVSASSSLAVENGANGHLLAGASPTTHTHAPHAVDLPRAFGASIDDTRGVCTYRRPSKQRRDRVVTFSTMARPRRFCFDFTCAARGASLSAFPPARSRTLTATSWSRGIGGLSSGGTASPSDDDYYDSGTTNEGGSLTGRAGDWAGPSVTSEIDRLERLAEEATTTSAYNEVLLGWAELVGDHSGHDDRSAGPEESGSSSSLPSMAVSRAASLLDEMMMDDGATDPDAVSFLRVLEVYSAARTVDAAEKALAVLQRMESLCDAVYDVVDLDAESAGGRLTITSEHYDAVLRALSNSREKGAPFRAQVIVNRMEKLRDEAAAATGSGTRSENVKPTTESFNNLIRCWVNSEDKMAAARAQEVHDRMVSLRDGQEWSDDEVDPDDGTTLSLLIEAWSKSSRRDAAFNATGHLLNMERLYKTGHGEAVKPSVDDYARVLSAWADSREEHKAARRAAMIFHNLEQMSESGALDFGPNFACYKALLLSWARFGGKEAAAKSDEVLSRLLELHDEGHEEMESDGQCFTAVIAAWAMSRKQIAAPRAQELLQRMEALQESGSNKVQPKSMNYTGVIKAWANSTAPDAAQNAEKVLLRMEQLYDEGNALVRPHWESYTAAIDAWVYSKEPGKAQKAHFILQHMGDRFQKGGNPIPNTTCYNSVINVCAHVSGGDTEKRSAFKTALSTMRALQKSRYRSPNEASYALLLKACAELIRVGQDRDNAVVTVFKEAARDGQVSENVVTQLRYAASFDTYKKLIGSWEVASLPAKWTRNINGSTTKSPVVAGGERRHMPSGESLRARKNQKLLRGGRMSMSDL